MCWGFLKTLLGFLQNLFYGTAFRSHNDNDGHANNSCRGDFFLSGRYLLLLVRRNSLSFLSPHTSYCCKLCSKAKGSFCNAVRLPFRQRFREEGLVTIDRQLPDKVDKIRKNFWCIGLRAVLEAFTFHFVSLFLWKSRVSLARCGEVFDAKFQWILRIEFIK